MIDAQFVTTSYNPIKNIANMARRMMIKQQQPDDFPSDGYIIDHWWTTARVVEETELTHAQSVVDAIKAGRLRGKKIGSKYRGQWYIDPASAQSFRRDAKGRKPSTDS